MFKDNIMDFLKIISFASAGSLLHISINKEESKTQYFISFCVSMVFGVTVYYLLRDFPQTREYAHVGCSAASLVGKDLLKIITSKIKSKTRNL
jgi:hypothetical protein